MTSLLYVLGRSGFRRWLWSPIRDPICEQNAKRAGFIPVIDAMLLPACEAGKPLCLPRRSRI
jgi:hypothetical protein